jgi:hypothetical protein
MAPGVSGVRSIRGRDGSQPGPPDERACVAQFQQLQGSDVAAEERTGVRQRRMLAAEVQGEP